MLVSSGSALLLAALCLCGQSFATACIPVSVSNTTELTLTESDSGSLCIVVPGEVSQQFRLTIRTPTYGRYSISRGTVGYGWNSPADGIHYCSPGNTTITFDEYVAGATVTVDAQLKPTDCISDFIGFNGLVPADSPDIGDTMEVYWSHHKYYLKASEFKFDIPGETSGTMQNGASIEIGGDPGSDTYHTIEVTWRKDGKEKRFYGYLDADTTDWWMYEARIYDETEEWVYFEGSQQAPLMSGRLNTCYEQDSIVLSSTDPPGSSMTFSNLALAAFLPWDDETAFLACIDSVVLAIDIGDAERDDADLRAGVAAVFGVETMQVDSLISRRRDWARGVRIAGRNVADAACIEQAATANTTAQELASRLGVSSVNIAVFRSSVAEGAAHSCDGDGGSEEDDDHPVTGSSMAVCQSLPALWLSAALLPLTLVAVSSLSFASA